MVYNYFTKFNDCVRGDGDFFWGLDSHIDPEFEVGCGNVLYISGWCFHSVSNIKKINIIFDNRVCSIVHTNIFRPDVIRLFFSDNGLIYKNSEQCGFWCAIPVHKISQDSNVQLIIQVILENGIKKTIIKKSIKLLKRIKSDICSGETMDIIRTKVSNIKNTFNSQQHVMICLATYNPKKELFENQIQSIKNQTYKNWSCIINDDHSDILMFNWICEFIGDDDRFTILRNSENIGFYNNFERLLYLVPENVDLIAFSDQDDYWFTYKLEKLVKSFDEDTALVYSDMKIVESNGMLISNTFWVLRKNYYDDIDYLVLVNTITGAASMFRRSMINFILPFPAKIGNTSYHDHWVGCVANALGEIKYIDEPLYDYYQHGDNVIGQSISLVNKEFDIIKFFRLISNSSYVKQKILYYQFVFNIDGVRSIMIALNLITRMPQMAGVKQNKLNKFLTMHESSLGLLGLCLQTTLNKKTTLSAERYLLKSYWADKLLRLKIFSNLMEWLK